MTLRPLPGVLLAAAALLLGACSSSEEAGDTTRPAVTSSTSSPASVPSTTAGAGPSTTVPTGAPTPPGAPTTSTPTPTVPPPIGDLPAIRPGAPIRMLSCEPDEDDHLVAIVELDNITDLPLSGRIEVLFETANAVEIERVIGETDRIQPEESGTATITSTEPITDEGAECYVIGLERTEYLPGE